MQLPDSNSVARRHGIDFWPYSWWKYSSNLAHLNVLLGKFDFDFVSDSNNFQRRADAALGRQLWAGIGIGT